MSSFPCLVRTVSGSGQVRYRLGEPLVDRFWSSWPAGAGRTRCRRWPSI
jgi:hypothetical protein